MMLPPLRSIQRRRFLGTATGGALLALAPGAWAQGYPERPVKIVSVTSPGTSMDDYSRLLARYVGQKLGQNVVIENRPGGNLMVGTAYVAKAAPDGYTLLLTTSSAMSANRHLYKQLPYNPDRDFAPIARLASVSLALVVSASSPYRSIAELIAAAKAKPGSLNVGSVAVGYRVINAALARSAGIEIAIIPYKGSAGLLTDLIGGQVDYCIIELASALSQIQAGKVRALAMATTKRLPIMPQVPTLAESGLQDPTIAEGMSRVFWFGLFAPAGTPQPIIDRISRLALEYVNSAEAAAHFNGRGTVPNPGTPAELESSVASDQLLWQRMIKISGLQPE